MFSILLYSINCACVGLTGGVGQIKAEKCGQLFRETSFGVGFSLRVNTNRFNKLELVSALWEKRWLKGTMRNRPTAEANKRASGPEPPLLPEGYGRAATAGRKRSPEEAHG